LRLFWFKKQAYAFKIAQENFYLEIGIPSGKKLFKNLENNSNLILILINTTKNQSNQSNCLLSNGNKENKIQKNGIKSRKYLLKDQWTKRIIIKNKYLN